MHRAGSHATTIHPELECLNKTVKVGVIHVMMKSFSPILTNVKHCILWLGLIIHRVEASDILEEPVEVGVRAREKIYIRKCISVCNQKSTHLGLMVASKRGKNRFLMMSWKFSTLLWVLEGKYFGKGTEGEIWA